MCFQLEGTVANNAEIGAEPYPTEQATMMMTSEEDSLDEESDGAET